ncbi:xanthine dehydrogenase family protein molybdopterin-binding subunit [Sphingomonas gilva]|uniref:Xanthine dehydrogenase family protein molybdopterin-binding subunit n=1 Tax=Sphingomonas gilva TaxID=2305907 RepID=A0A396RSS7_9SPHN|nr:xanthine dehydrogenase family protein molybdopterin-binding subunit [Sphingomonas gilva]RHW19136.1 xanthine dehydrogenase family protein molybdopterin-binding subunit [Sphingomonas gilva]
MREVRMDGPYRPAALGASAQGLLGRPVDRYDGAAKVSGTAGYAFEGAPEGTLYGHVVGAEIGAGRVLSVDVAAAEAMPGVVAVIHDDPRMPSGEANSEHAPKVGPADRIHHYGQPIAIVVAESQEAARAAAGAVRIDYAPSEGRFDSRAAEVEHDHKLGFLPTIRRGDLDAALAEAEVVFDERYATPVHFPAALEPHATIAWWDGDRLTVRASLQIVGAARTAIAVALDMPEAKVRVLAPYVGGGFGGKTGVGPETILAAIAARRTGRPVKIALPRRQIAYLGHHRTDTVQRLRIGCNRDGRISAIAHEGVAAQKEDRTFLEPIPFGTLPLYAGKVRHFATSLVRVDLPGTGAVRAPGEAIGTFAIECAMDELAERLGLDPIELRRRNEPETDPLSGKPFSTRRLLDCYDEGARRFGWDRRAATPGSVREGEWLIGAGMAASLRGNFTVKSEARVTLDADGRAVIETDMTDIGTGTYTILAQVAGEMLGLGVDRIDVRLGDSEMPPSAGSGGSFGAGSSASAVALACEDILAELARRMNAAPEELSLKDGVVTAGGRSTPLADLVRGKPIVASGRMGPGKESKATSQASHGAHFCEVAVNGVTGEVRVRRMLGVFDVGRVLNEKTARSQIVGGVIWGIAYALSEDGVVDVRSGRFVNPDFGEYHVAVNADVPQIECHFIEEVDDHANPAGAKAVGELGISGAGAAVANAVYNATGVRVRDFPITLDKLLPGLPPV